MANHTGRTCSVCGEGIPSGDVYACGISLAGWPHSVPVTLYCHRSTCRDAALAAANAAADEAERRRGGDTRRTRSGSGQAGAPMLPLLAGVM